MSKPVIYIIRGLPGSGKSYIAKKLVASHQNLGKRLTHVEADMWFEWDCGYKFDPTELKQAHDWAKGKLKREVLKGNSVVVSNTFTRKWEVDGYLEGLDSIADVMIIKAIGEYKNVHGVPDAVIDTMRSRWEDYPGEVVCDELLMKELVN